MKKTLIFLLLVLVVLGGGAYYLVTSRVVDQLQLAQQQLAPFGTLQYGAVRITPGGALQVHQLAFYPHASNDVLRVDRTSLVTNSLFTLMQVAAVVRSDQVPESLRFELQGLQMDFRGDWLATLTDDADSGQARHLYAAGCAERDYFTFADLDLMGYQNVRTDMSLEYRWSLNTSRLLVLGNLTTEGMYQLAFNVDLAIAGDATDPMAAMMATQLRRLEFSYTNLGFTNSVINYCARETGLTQEAFLDQHVDAWQALWRDAHIELGDDIVDGYRAFMNQPERLTIEAFPAASLMQLAMAGSPEATLDQLAPQLTVNQGEPRPFELAFVEPPPPPPSPAPQEQSTASMPEEPSATGRTNRSPGRVVAVNELEDIVDQAVVVRLSDGRRYEGRVVTVENERLHLERSLFNGQMVMPVRFEDIGEVRLRGE
ncbi:MAG: LSm family protein [Saccharospirillum sp.]